MRILFVAMSDSIHTARWINQISDQGWDIHLFPSIDRGVTHPDLQKATVYHSFYTKSKNRNKTLKLSGIPLISKYEAFIGRETLKRLWPDSRRLYLADLIKRLHPDVIHSMEMQAAGYLTMAVRKKFAGQFPTWIVTNWGNDIYLFGRFSEHVDKIKEVLASCDYYSCECHRDVRLAEQMGLKGQVLPVLPNAGGYNLARLAQFRQPGPTSARRLILLKGYQDWKGRALVGLQAIELCADALKGYRIGIYLANPEIKIAAESVSKSTSIPIDIIPYCSHDNMMRQYGKARVYIGLSISDGISISELEAIMMGAFPIQSCTACADEWIINGETGFIVPPEDPEPIAAAIRRAVSDDALVDRAAELNAQVARERLDERVIKPQVIAMYEKIAAEAHLRKGR
jgi:glycosyltransferase involved in cell wall biosynthesis